jgi:hypothetical protein
MHSGYRKPLYSTKVFCIGFHKTGTTSLGAALSILGYKVAGATGIRDPNIAMNVLALASRVTEAHDAFQDNPWPIIFRQMDLRFPGSKFILTSRDPNSWIDSVVRHFGNKETEMRKWIYGVGSPIGHEKIFLERYKTHQRDVIGHFAGRPNDLLVMDLRSGDGWDKLCPFLGHAVPTRPFPHLNKSSDRVRGGK